jgi:S-ribosylhomocysteine lyase LuxS involved in autoinducer biosynthesis
MKKLKHKWSLLDDGKQVLIAIITASLIGAGSMIIMSMVNKQKTDDAIEVLKSGVDDLKKRVYEIEKSQRDVITKRDLKEFKHDIREVIRLQIELNKTGKEIKEKI